MEHGLNVSFDSPASRAIVWADAMERARSLDPLGTRLFDDVDLPPGKWVVAWQGSGKAELVGAVQDTKRISGRAEYLLEPNSRPLSVRWSGEVKHLHVWLPASEGHWFYQPFVLLMRHLKPAALRTLDWSLPNVPPEARDGRLVPPELQASLVNKIPCGLHYCVPMGLSEAELVRLFRVLGVVVGDITVEAGNENWNSGLWSWNYLSKLGGKVIDQAAKEIQRVFTIAERELPRARHYVGGQLSNPWFLKTLLDLLPSSVRVDAAGAAAYVGPREVPQTADLAVAACLERVEAIRLNVREHVALAKARGARPEFYEAGQSFTKGSKAVALAQRSKGMAEVYVALAAMLEAEGVERVSWYSLMTSQDTIDPAPFGVFESMTGKPLPKAQALMRLMGASGL